MVLHTNGGYKQWWYKHCETCSEMFLVRKPHRSLFCVQCHPECVTEYNEEMFTCYCQLHA